jgi:hypothetical protein
MQPATQRWVDESVKFKSEAITNLSTMVNIVAISLNNGLLKMVSEMEWLNNSMINQREAFVVAGQLDFALTQIEFCISEIIHAVEYVMLGKIPINLISPATLCDILENVTLMFPENFELFAAIKFSNLYLYYEMVEAIILADVHSFKVVLNVQLNTIRIENLFCTRLCFHRENLVTNTFNLFYIITIWQLIYFPKTTF